MSSIKKVRKLLPRNIIGNIFFLFLCCLIAALTLVEPLFLADLITVATGSMLFERYYLIFIVLIIFLARIILIYLKNRWLYTYRCKCICNLSTAMLNHLLHGKMKNFESLTPSYLIARITDEPMNIDGILDYYLIDGILSLFICVGITVIMALQSWLISIILVLFVIVNYITAMKLPLSKIYKEYNESNAIWKSQASNVLQGVKVVKLGNRYAFENEKFVDSAETCLKMLFKKNIVNHLQRTAGTVCRQFGYVSLILISALFIASGELGVGAFTMLISLNNLIWSNSSTAVNMIPLYKYGKVTCDRIQDILRAEIEEMHAAPIKINVKTFEFKDVSFSYINDQPVLNSVTLCAKAGQITALAGYSGCGKSTLLNIILGFIEQDQGDIMINEESINSTQLRGLRTKIGYVGQESFLFNRSIIDNLLYYVDDNQENRNKIDRYLKLFGLENLIDSLPCGIDSILGDNSSTVSGGEKQRLCIIRELLKEPAILILDEFTAHLDAASENSIFNILRIHAKNAIIIQVAHRASALANSDIIYVIDKGAILAQGTHEALVESSEFYRTLLASLQSEKGKG